MNIQEIVESKINLPDHILMVVQVTCDEMESIINDIDTARSINHNEKTLIKNEVYDAYYKSLGRILSSHIDDFIKDNYYELQKAAGNVQFNRIAEKAFISTAILCSKNKSLAEVDYKTVYIKGNNVYIKGEN
jgi:hypothetical protein